MNLKNEQIIKIMKLGSLKKLMSLTDIEVDAVFGLSEIEEELNKVLKSYFKVTNDVAEKFGERDKDGQLIVDGDQIPLKAEGRKKIFDLNNISVKINHKKITIDRSDIPKGVLCGEDVSALNNVVYFTDMNKGK